MKSFFPLLMIAIGLACSALAFWGMGKPQFWSLSIAAFEKADRKNPPKPGVIVFVGSSSIRFWSTLQDDMKPLDVVNRGFGGSQIAHVNIYADRIVIPYRPRAVVLYAGDNDLSWPWSKSPERVFQDFREFVQIVHANLPDTWIYFISIKPSILRWTDWSKSQRTNEMIRNYCLTEPRVQYIDVDAAMLGLDGKPRRDIFRLDGLHMNAKGYAIWTSIIKPVLLARFAPAPASVSAKAN
jgi:lysophospholipase L1-like esterase